VFTYEFRCTIITPLKQTTRSEIIMEDLQGNDYADFDYFGEGDELELEEDEV
jgi:hypothetical protein